MTYDGPFCGLQGIVYDPDAIRVIVFRGLQFWCNQSNPSELLLDCIKSAIQPQSSGLQNAKVLIARRLRQPRRACFGGSGAPRGASSQGSSLSSRIAIQTQSEWAQFRSSIIAESFQSRLVIPMSFRCHSDVVL